VLKIILFVSLQRQFKRDGWHERAQDALYRKQPFDCQPLAAPFPLFDLTEQYVSEVPPPAPVVVAAPIVSNSDHKDKKEKYKGSRGDKHKQQQGEEKGARIKSHPAAAPPAPRHPHQGLHEVAACVEQWRELFAARMREEQEQEE
jgi:hypothetical protein